MIQGMLVELGELGTHTGRFNDNVQRYADAIARADSLQGLAGVVQEMVDETRAVQPGGQRCARAAERRARPRHASSSSACATSNPSCGACPTRYRPMR